MAIGDATLVYHGSHNISSSGLFNAVGQINHTYAAVQSGSRIFLLPSGFDGKQVSVYEVRYA